jgi:hypothetical protein
VLVVWGTVVVMPALLGAVVVDVVGEVVPGVAIWSTPGGRR